MPSAPKWTEERVKATIENINFLLDVGEPVDRIHRRVGFTNRGTFFSFVNRHDKELAHRLNPNPISFDPDWWNEYCNPNRYAKGRARAKS